MPIKNWSPNADNNTSNSPNGAPEGMQPAKLNDVARQIMADVRAHAEDGGWFDWGHTPTYVSNKSFSVPGDLTTVYHEARSLKIELGSGTYVYSKIKSSTFSGNKTTVVIKDTNITNAISAISLGLDDDILGFKTGLDGLCTAKSINNGNKITLQAYSKTIPASFSKGSIYRFFADSNNDNSVTVNDVTVKFNGTVLPKNFIKKGDEIIIIYNGTDFEIINRKQTPTEVRIMVTKDTHLYTSTVPSGKTAVTTAVLERYLFNTVDTADQAIQLPLGKRIKLELYGSGQGGGSGSSDGSNGADSTITGTGFTSMKAKGGATSPQSGSTGGMVEDRAGAQGAISFNKAYWTDPSYTTGSTGKNGMNGQKVTSTVILTTDNPLTVDLGDGGAGVSPSPKGQNAYLIISYFI